MYKFWTAASVDLNNLIFDTSLDSDTFHNICLIKMYQSNPASAQQKLLLQHSGF